MHWYCCRMHESGTDIDGSMMMNLCVCLDGKSSDEDLFSSSRHKFWYSQKRNGKGAANNGSADTQSIRFVRKVFVCSNTNQKIYTKWNIGNNLVLG